MTEHVVKIDLRDIQISIILFDEAFSMKRVESSASERPLLVSGMVFGVILYGSTLLSRYIASTNANCSLAFSIAAISPDALAYSAWAIIEKVSLKK